MLTRCFILWILTILQVSGVSVRVATFNLQNYLLTHRTVEGVRYTHYPKPLKEKQALYQVLVHTNADIVAVQEIGGPEFIHELQQDLKSLGLDYPHMLWVQAKDPTRHIALLSKQPSIRHVAHTELPFNYYKATEYVKRGLLEAHFEHNGVQWTLWTAHLKSQSTLNPKDKEAKLFRYKEALAISHLLKKDQPFLLLGDLNTQPNTTALRALLRKDHKPLTTALLAVDSRGEYWTYHQAKTHTYSRLDYILASSQMLPYIHSTHIQDIQPYSLQASDHRLVYVDLTF